MPFSEIKNIKYLNVILYSFSIELSLIEISSNEHKYRRGKSMKNKILVLKIILDSFVRGMGDVISKEKNNQFVV